LATPQQNLFILTNAANDLISGAAG